MATDQLDLLGSLTKEERTWILCRSYPLFAAYYFDLTMADFMAATTIWRTACRPI